MKLNKRGEVGAVIEDSIAAFLIVIFVFTFLTFSQTLFHFEKNDIKITADKQALFLEQTQLTNEISNLTYKIEGEEVTFIDLLRLSKIDAKYKTILDEKISEIQKIYSDFKITEKALSEIDSGKNIITVVSNQTAFYEVKIK